MKIDLKNSLRLCIVAAALNFCSAPAFAVGQGNAVDAGYVPMENAKPFHLAADIQPGSALDVSFLNPKPAGKFGWLKAEGEMLRFASGRTVRFLGVNMAWDALFPPENEAMPVAKRLAMSGVNMVRLTYLDDAHGRGVLSRDADNSFTLDPGKMAKLDRFVADLRKEGVYTMTVLGMGRYLLKAGDDVPDWVIGPGINARATISVGRYFVDEIARVERRIWRALLTHVNPYTGKRWIDDPALPMLELVNEGSPYYLEGSFEKTPEPLQQIIKKQWNQWLSERYHTRSAWVKAWGDDVASNDQDPTQGTVKLDFTLLNTSAKPGDTSNHQAADWNRFLSHVAHAYYAKQTEFLRSLGAKQLIDCAGGGSFSLADKWSTRGADIFDQHGYFAHPSSMKKGSFIYDNAGYLKTGMNLFQTLARRRPAGRPSGITETDFCFPNDWRAAGWIPFISYARLQKWSYVVPFCYAANSWKDRDRYYGPKGHISGVWRWHNDPATFGQWPVMAMVFLRGDVAPARQTIDAHFSDEDIFMQEKAKFAHQLEYLKNVPLVHAIRQLYKDQKGNPKHIQINSGRASGDVHKMPVHAKNGWIESDTGQLRYRQDPGVFVIDTPRTQGACGWIQSLDQPVRTQDLILTCKSRFGSITVTSLDARPLSSSRHMLVTAVGRCQNTDFSPKPAEGGKMHVASAKALGKGPILIEPLQFTLKVRQDDAALEKWSVYALDERGRRVEQLSSTSADGQTQFTSDGQPVTIYYEWVQE